MSEVRLRVVKVLFDQDLRGIHKLRKKVRCRGGECWVLVNRAATMYRLVDCEQGVYSKWAKKGRRLDTDDLRRMVGVLRVRLIVDSEDAARIDSRSERKVLNAA